MKTWNYRVMRDGDGRFGIHEVYYNAAGDPVMWTETPDVGPCEALVGLRSEIEDMSRAIMKPVLDYDMEPGELDG